MIKFSKWLETREIPTDPKELDKFPTKKTPEEISTAEKASELRGRSTGGGTRVIRGTKPLT